MDKLLMCRICLAEDVTMHCLDNTKLQEIYEKLTEISFQSVNSRPLQVCYMCYGKLQNCHRLQINCIESEEYLNKMHANNPLKPKLIMSSLKTVHPLVQLSCVPVIVEPTSNEEDQNMEPVDMIHVKEEYIEAAEDNVTDNELMEEYTGGTDIVKYEDITIEDNNMLNYSTNTVRDNYDLTSNRDQMALQDIKPVASDVKNQKCEKLFGQKQHIQHTGEKLYRCDICQRIFKSESSLTLHCRIHGKKLHVCDVCRKSFKTRYNLTVHIRTHTGEKPYKCDVCEKCFTLKQKLIYHIQTHMREKHYKCDICNKCFMRKLALNAHAYLHTGKKPYQCDVCEKSFTRMYSLTDHARTHSKSGKKKYIIAILEPRPS